MTAADRIAHGCTCPEPCIACPPLTSDDEAEVEYRAFSSRTTNPNRPGDDTPGAA